jgi:hypothetical protein
MERPFIFDTSSSSERAAVAAGRAVSLNRKRIGEFDENRHLFVLPGL